MSTKEVCMCTVDGILENSMQDITGLKHMCSRMFLETVSKHLILEAMATCQILQALSIIMPEDVPGGQAQTSNDRSNGCTPVGLRTTGTIRNTYTGLDKDNLD
ncbi:6345_t:CDS:2 [Paraglomus brasilianum]|uniref:6345_t:CDS:1 n=1 Tax=Paraglomus brasilianum TaxID=144538 RepID=A0A9N8WJQ1_9GLOM|nr:6345_t:CDS:2 [Paraglomus brasilianum]